MNWVGLGFSERRDSINLCDEFGVKWFELVG